MMIYGYIPKAKRKVPKSKQIQYDNWLNDISKMSTNFTKNTSKKISTNLPLKQEVYRRETPQYASMGASVGAGTKPNPNIYTGTKVKGIATMHKSNAVPVFTDEEAISISGMRR